MLPTIEVTGLSKQFRFPTVRRRGGVKDLVVRTIRHEGRNAVVDALNDVSFTVERGTTLGIIGRNGSGKSTLLRILAGIIQPDYGDVRIHGSVAPLLALGAGFHPDLTGREGARIELLSLGLTRAQTERMMERVVTFSEIGDFIDHPVHTYSSGMLSRLAFSVAVSVDPDVLLLDEILSVGDEAFAQKCMEYMAGFKRAGKTIVLVTHASDFVRTWCDRVLWIDEGRVRRYGAPREVIGAYHAATGIVEHGTFADDAQSPDASPSPGSFSFTCNACGIEVPLAEGDELSRERGRCPVCGSFVRLRAVVHLISRHLFGRSLPVPDWPEHPAAAIVGVCDPPFFASTFANKASYNNAQIDLAALPAAFHEQADIAISCDALLLVKPVTQRAFDGLFSLLRPGGLLALTLPYTFEEAPGHYSLGNIKRHLRDAGFTDIHLFDEDHLAEGIAFPQTWSLPITARRPG
jgi:ABC-type polysaccharide/polyol phosphate transport system ATPase subunit